MENQLKNPSHVSDLEYGVVHTLDRNDKCSASIIPQPTKANTSECYECGNMTFVAYKGDKPDDVPTHVRIVILGDLLKLTRLTPDEFQKHTLGLKDLCSTDISSYTDLCSTDINSISSTEEMEYGIPYVAGDQASNWFEPMVDDLIDDEVQAYECGELLFFMVRSNNEHFRATKRGGMRLIVRLTKEEFDNQTQDLVESK